MLPCCVLLALALLPSCGGSTLECGQVPCPDQLLITGALSYTGSEPVRLLVKLCRNQQCSESEIQAEALGKVRLPLPEPVPAMIELTSSGPSDPWQLAIRLNDFAGEDGDTLTLRLTTVPGGTTIFDKSTAPVTYAVVRPNGPDCSPACRSAVVMFD
jgi:hypothetical protein